MIGTWILQSKKYRGKIMTWNELIKAKVITVAQLHLTSVPLSVSSKRISNRDFSKQLWGVWVSASGRAALEDLCKPVSAGWVSASGTPALHIFTHYCQEYECQPQTQLDLTFIRQVSATASVSWQHRCAWHHHIQKNEQQYDIPTTMWSRNHEIKLMPTPMHQLHVLFDSNVAKSRDKLT